MPGTLCSVESQLSQGKSKTTKATTHPTWEHGPRAALTYTLTQCKMSGEPTPHRLGPYHFAGRARLLRLAVAMREALRRVHAVKGTARSAESGMRCV